VVEEYKEPEPTWEYEAEEYLDDIFEENLDHSEGMMVTMTFANGLVA